MYLSDGGFLSTRLKSEVGSWACVVVFKTKGKEGIQSVECGAFPSEKEEIHMPENVGSCGMSLGVTLNMGNYESARVDAWLTLPCTETSADEITKQCHDFVSRKIKEKSETLIAKRDAGGDWRG